MATLYALILCRLAARRVAQRPRLHDAMVAALALSDMVSGIFKGNGLLGDLLPGLRGRGVMFTPSLEGMEVAPTRWALPRIALRPVTGPGPFPSRP